MIRSFPFTGETYFSLFETYNAAIFPLQLAAYALGILVVVLALRPVASGARIALAVLAAFWLWTGVVYQFMYFLEINFAALGFGTLFVLQGVLLAASAVRGGRALRFNPDVFGWVGLFACLFALVAYPLLAWLSGHGWPRAAVFGVTPPTLVIFTFGTLLMLEGRAPLHLGIIPLLWSLAAGTAAIFRLGAPEDLSLLLAGIAGFVLLVWKRRL